MLSRMIEDQYEPLPPTFQPTFTPSSIFHCVFDYSESPIPPTADLLGKMGNISDLLLMTYRFVIQREPTD